MELEDFSGRVANRIEDGGTEDGGTEDGVGPEGGTVVEEEARGGLTRTSEFIDFIATCSTFITPKNYFGHFAKRSRFKLF